MTPSMGTSMNTTFLMSVVEGCEDVDGVKKNMFRFFSDAPVREYKRVIA